MSHPPGSGTHRRLRGTSIEPCPMARLNWLLIMFLWTSAAPAAPIWHSYVMGGADLSPYLPKGSQILDSNQSFQCRPGTFDGKRKFIGSYKDGTVRVQSIVQPEPNAEVAHREFSDAAAGAESLLQLFSIGPQLDRSKQVMAGDESLCYLVKEHHRVTWLFYWRTSKVWGFTIIRCPQLTAKQMLKLAGQAVKRGSKARPVALVEGPERS